MRKTSSDRLPGGVPGSAAGGQRAVASPAAPPTARGRRTRAALLTAAREVFERDGFQDARVTDIADTAGAAYGTFYTYFASKDDVFRALVEDLLEQLRPVPRSPDQPVTPYQAIERANRAYVVAFRDHAKLMILWAQVAGHHAPLAELLETQREQYADRAERSIRRLQQQGLAEVGLDPYYTARALCGMVVEMCAQWFGTGLAFELEPTVQTLTEVWARAIGLRPDDERSGA